MTLEPYNLTPQTHASKKWITQLYDLTIVFCSQSRLKFVSVQICECLLFSYNSASQRRIVIRNENSNRLRNLQKCLTSERKARDGIVVEFDNNFDKRSEFGVRVFSEG